MKNKRAAGTGHARLVRYLKTHEKEGNAMMMRGNIRKWFMLVVLVFVMVVAGEVWGIRAVSAARPIKLRMMMSSEPKGNGLDGANTLAYPLMYNVYEPLVDLGKKGESVPRLATKWEHSADLTKWRFYLRKGVKFHNGADFTARDVVEYVKWNQEETLTQVHDRVPVKQAVAIDDYTIDLIFGNPQPLLLIQGRVFLIHPAAISRDSREMAITHPTGTGPYKFVEWKKGLYIKLAKFEDYWGPKPQIDEVEIVFREEEQVRLAALLAGEVDWIYGIGPEAAVRAPKVTRMPSPDTIWLRFDESIQREWTGKDPLFADKRLRLAVEYAIDRKAIVDMYRGFATPSLGQFASPGDFGFNPNLKSRPYDLEKAKALVREAGAVGKTVTFVGFSDRWTKDREVAEAIAYMIEQTGLKVKLIVAPKSEAETYRYSMGPTRNKISDLFIASTDTALEVESRYPWLFVEGNKNYTITDQQPAKMYKEAISETDYAKRGEKLSKAWAYVYEQSHYIPLFKIDMMWGIAKNLEWKTDIAGRPFIADMKFTQ